MNTVPSGSMSPERPAASSPTEPLRALFMDVATEDQAALEALCPNT